MQDKCILYYKRGNVPIHNEVIQRCLLSCCVSCITVIKDNCLIALITDTDGSHIHGHVKYFP